MRFLKGFLLALMLVLALAFGFLFSSFNSSVESDPFELPATPQPTPEPSPGPTPEPVFETAPAPEFTAPAAQESEAEPQPETIVISVCPFEGEETGLSILPGEGVSLSDYSVPEDFTFIGWVDGSGKIVSADSVYTDSTVLKQICVPRFTDAEHAPLLSLENGIFRSSGTVEKEVFLTFFNTYLNSGARPAAFESSIDFKSETPLTYGEAWTALSLFMPLPEGLETYPASSADKDFALSCAEFYGWIPEGADGSELFGTDITRLDYVKLLCGILGRSGDSEQKQEYVGTILDIVPANPDYAVIAEALIPHSFEGCGSEEIWTESTPSDAEALKPGINISDGKIYFVKDDGALAVAEEINGFSYGDDGVYTSGNPELDALVFEAIKNSDAEKEPDTLQQLKTVFYYIVYHTTYRKGALHEDGSRDWVEDTAIEMLSTMKGNCYSYACAFWACARALGYDATVYTGMLNSSSPARPHGWVEINLDGTMYLCDPEISYQQIRFMNEFADLFMQGSVTYNVWGYERYPGQE